MTNPTTVDDPITDAVTQANEKVLGDAPTTALDDPSAKALADDPTARPQAALTAQATTTMGVDTLLTTDTATTGHATRPVVRTIATKPAV